MKYFLSFPRLTACAASVAALVAILPATLAQTIVAPTAGSTPVMGSVGVSTPIASTPGVPTLGISSSINVLILALDEADYKSARPSNLTEPKPLRSRPLENAAPPANTEPAPFLPPAPAPRVPLPPIFPNEQPAGQLPAAIVPAGTQSGESATRRALAQIAPAQVAPARAIPDLPSSETDARGEMEIPNRRAPGLAQTVAAPLRRALVALGVSDVLTTPLDGPTVVRSLNAGRIGIRTVDRLRFSTEQMLATIGAAEMTAAQLTSFQAATKSAARIGLSLGYRAVVVLAIAPGGEYSALLVDSVRESGERLALPAGTNALSGDANAASDVAAALIARLREWAPFTPADRVAKLETHMSAARAALEKNDLEVARDNLMQAVSLDASYADAYILLGDISQNSDPVAAAAAYQRAAEINTQNGAIWARIAIVHTLSSPPDWVRALSSATKSLSLGYDSANLRTAMAAAEFGRADLFRRSARPEQAEDAELVARRHLERARELAPDDPEVVAGVSRLMGKYLLDQKRFREAVQSLDLLAIQYPNDLPTQLMYAKALEGYGKREEDLFAAWSRVWRLGGDSDIALDATRYARITDGFDQRIFALAKNVFQMTSGVASGALPRETALLQAERARDEMKTTVGALQLMRPPSSRAVAEAHVSRLFAADLMQQAVVYYIYYLETGTDLNRSRAVDLHRQAIEGLNTARGGAAAGGAR